jgi:hypothetical protein
LLAVKEKAIISDGFLLLLHLLTEAAAQIQYMNI